MDRSWWFPSPPHLVFSAVVRILCLLDISSFDFNHEKLCFIGSLDPILILSSSTFLHTHNLLLVRIKQEEAKIKQDLKAYKTDQKIIMSNLNKLFFLLFSFKLFLFLKLRI